MTAFDVTILDAGPSLNFFSIGRADLLLAVVRAGSARIAVPEDVDEEIRRKAGPKSKFARAGGALDWALRTEQILRLDSTSDRDSDLDRNVSRITGLPFEQRVRKGKDLGEMMVVAHALTLQNQGEKVIALIDDLDGQRLAAKHRVRYMSTIDILRGAARLGLIKNWGEMRQLYLKMEPLDDGLPSVTAPRIADKLKDARIYRPGAA